MIGPHAPEKGWLNSIAMFCVCWRPVQWIAHYNPSGIADKADNALQSIRYKIEEFCWSKDGYFRRPHRPRQYRPSNRSREQTRVISSSFEDFFTVISRIFEISWKESNLILNRFDLVERDRFPPLGEYRPNPAEQACWNSSVVAWWIFEM